MSEQSDSLTSSVVVDIESQKENQLPSYLQVLAQHRLVLCTTHGSCYTHQNLGRHLLEKHQLRAHLRRQILLCSRLEQVATTRADVVQPVDGIDEILGLPTARGFICHHDGCPYRSINTDQMRQHYNNRHQWKVAHQGAMPWHEAFLQTLFSQSQNIQYFAVVLADRVRRPGTPQNICIYPHANAPDNAPTSLTPEHHHPSPPSAPAHKNAWDRIMGQFDESQARPRSTKIDRTHHVSDLNPFMKRTGIHIHLQGLDLADLGPSWRLPDPDREPNLHLICQSAGRVLKDTMTVLVHDQNLESRQLSRRNAGLLNTFTRGEASQDRISDLQNQQCRQKYIGTWKQLICYWERVVEQGQLRESLFQPSERQLQAWVEVTEAAGELATLGGGTETDEATDSDSDSDLNQKASIRRQLDRAVLEFSLSIIQHLVPRRKFDSVLVSYAAVRFWSPGLERWMMIRNYTSILSKLIYDCQMMVLARVLADTVDDTAADIGACIIDIRDRWLLNDTDGPVAELLENRLLGFHIARSEVPPAQLRWHADGKTLVWSDVILHLHDVRDIIFRGLARAQQIFTEELCLSGQSSPVADIPRLDLDLLVDNWDATSNGQSFVTDSRNAAHLDPLRPWLISRVGQTPVLFHTFFQKNMEDEWVIGADTAQQYENTVQRFLRALITPFFLGSGQHGRRTEFIALRWRNSILTTRDLFLHDGQMLFILSYHKSRHRTNASRWPVRFLLPEAAQLVAQYLVMIQPFREFLHAQAQVPVAVPEYLFSGGRAPWTDDAMTRAIVNTGKQVLGKRIHIQAWRQLTKGIVRRKFTPASAGMFIEDGEGMDDEDEASGPPGPPLGSLPEAVHWQTSHTPHTGNQAYGGTVNFRGGLTDAGLQEYRHVSQLWHQLTRDPVHFRVGPTRRGDTQTPWEWDATPTQAAPTQATPSQATASERERSEAERETPIARRIAIREAPARTRRRWRMEQATEMLRRMYGTDAQYRSAGQRRAMEHIVGGAGQVLAILRTSEGKSLLYLLPCQLPGAGTTVLNLPLVALKAEMERRCAEAGIAAHVWEARSDPDRLHSCPLIIVGVEQAVRPRFREFLNRLHMGNGLDRVVFDECHLAVTALWYRPAMGLLPLLRDLECPMVFLTGTMPPSLVGEFERAMLLRGARMVGSHTTRRDITVRVSYCPPKRHFSGDFAIPGIQSLVASIEPGTRAIIYCQRRDAAEEMAQATTAPVYQSRSGSIEEKAEALQRWHDGDPSHMVATSAFGLGIDHGAVRWVVHMGVPHSMIDFAQEVGRLGRDGAGGQSLILVPPRWRATTNDRDGRPLGAAEATMQTYIQTTTCRVLEMSRFLDEDGRACDSEALMCDRCQDGGTVQIRKRMADDAVEGTVKESEVDDMEGLRAGAELLRTQTQGQACELADHIASLEAWQVMCMICYHLPRRASGQRTHARHPLGACANPKRFSYLDAKQKALSRGRARGGWFPRFSSCYRCFNLQVVCDQQGRGQCQFTDLVMPICWAVFQRKGWAKQYLSRLGGEHVSEREEAYMQWLGEEQKVFGEPASNATAVANMVLQQMSVQMSVQINA
ncbi:hypothetical protein ACJ73_05575 [Blastomyces percursus]|uniref:DNA 3'-5' helicase n=1 Tax=Blastomyces percursus TaxID=1658174 RepID=A0A1J9Q362_9EURO|nr:hypothetical protein ACJ73_05575 [Blastomyces percursus]